MTVVGPQGQILYSAHEAYNIVGRQLFGDEWKERFSAKPSPPDMAFLDILSASGASLPDDAKELQQADRKEADTRQTQLRRENEALDDLVDAVDWGKTASWYRLPDWQLISSYDWKSGAPARPGLIQLLTEDTAAVLRDSRPDPQRLLFDKDMLDAWKVFIVPRRKQRSPRVRAKPAPAHRPGINLRAIRAESHRRYDHGSVDLACQGWRSRHSEDLAEWYEATHPEDPHPPKATTIRKRLKPDFDTYRDRRRRG